MSKTIKLLSSFSLLTLSLLISPSSRADTDANGWVGTLTDYRNSHSSSHNLQSEDHLMTFTRSSDGKSFTVVAGAADLLKAHLESDSSLLVEVTGRITSKFLFFGGNMVIENSKVLQQLAQVDHKNPRTYDRSERPLGGSERRK